MLSHSTDSPRNERGTVWPRRVGSTATCARREACAGAQQTRAAASAHTATVRVTAMSFARLYGLYRYGDTPDRFARRVGRRARADARQGEGAHPGARRAGRRAPPDAVARRREGLRVRGARRPCEPARPLRRAPPADRLPLLLRARRGALPRDRLRGLLVPGRSGRPSRAPQRARHDARVRLASAPGRHRALEGADGLGADPVVHDRRHLRLRQGLRRRRVARHQRVHPRRRPRLPHLLRRQPRRRGDGQHVELPRHHGARAPGGVGGLARGLSPDAAVPVVEPARRVRTMSYASVNGLDMYYEVHGEGRPLVLLHGAYMTIDLMGPILAGLAETRQVIAVEQQGHGRTADIDRPITYEQMADDTAALIRHLDLDAADVFGFSMGGAVALQLAIRHPQLVRRLVVASASYRSDGMPAEALAMFPSITPEMFAGSPIEEAYQRLAPNPGDFPTLVAKLKELDTTSFAWPDEDVRGIAAPTLIVLGDSDGVTLEHAVQMFQLLGGGVMGDLSGMPKSQLAVLPGTSHFVPPGSGVLDRADWLLAMVPPFLDAS